MFTDLFAVVATDPLAQTILGSLGAVALVAWVIAVLFP